jgi:hypothetical protein
VSLFYLRYSEIFIVLIKADYFNLKYSEQIVCYLILNFQLGSLSLCSRLSSFVLGSSPVDCALVLECFAAGPTKSECSIACCFGEPDFLPVVTCFLASHLNLNFM